MPSSMRGPARRRPGLRSRFAYSHRTSESSDLENDAGGFDLPSSLVQKAGGCTTWPRATALTAEALCPGNEVRAQRLWEDAPCLAVVSNSFACTDPERARFEDHGN